MPTLQYIILAMQHILNFQKVRRLCSSNFNYRTSV